MTNRLFIFAILCGGLWAQENGIPVIVDGREVVRVYSGVGTFTAADRVPEIERRIAALGEKHFTGEVTTRSIPSEQATAVVAGGVIVMAVTTADAETAGVPRAELAQKYAAAIHRAIEGYRVRHSWYSFLKAVLLTLLAWSLFFGSVWALRKAVLWLGERLERLFSRHAAESGARRFHLLMAERGRLLLMTAVRFLVMVALVCEFSFAISYTLGLFPQTAGISTTLLDFLRHTFGLAAQALIDYLPSGGFVLIAMMLAHYLLRILKFLSSAIESGDLTIKGLHPEMAKPTYQLVRIIVLLFGLVVVFPFLPGGKSEAFKGVSIFLGLLLSLGSSSAVSNVLAGLVLTYMRPFRGGDRVKIADTLGDVLEKSLLVTRLRTIKNVEVVIPNSSILNNQILNYSALARTTGLILNTTVTIGYDAPWRKVHALLVRAALNTDGILPAPPPFVLETSMNDFHISYELNAYTDRANDTQDIYSRLHEAIQDSFNEGGVEIMSPTFYALRDGNPVTIPEAYRPANYQPPAFRVNETRAGDGRNISPMSATK
ncbi:MAG: mechanosensitive ion channel domain-containing protein [Candidatus Solibacter sp.]